MYHEVAFTVTVVIRACISRPVFSMHILIPTLLPRYKQDKSPMNGTNHAFRCFWCPFLGLLIQFPHPFCVGVIDVPCGPHRADT
jgi:hypothetical protein